ncbi:MAG: FAD-binding protein [Chlamydiae bacterium]|nr:FAD-binding protein [Chlamydiota bacterium]
MTYESHEHDVIIIGAGGAGLRAAIEAASQGLRVAVICKSLLGKAHTVMAEGGIAAAMGKILQRDFGGHRYARLAHVGDRTGLEIIRTLQHHGIHQGIDVYMECTITKLLKDGEKISGAFGYWRETGKFAVFKAKAVILATGGIGKCWKITSNSWEGTGDGVMLALEAGAALIDMECQQFHPTGMVWPPSVKGILVTEGVRGEGGTLRNSKDERFMFRYIPEFFKAETADNEAEADRWYKNKKNNRRTPDLLPRDEVARSINSEIKAGRGSPHGGVFLDIASRLGAEDIKKKLPSMYHQFIELSGVDITKERMEVGPTAHYMNGGIRVVADTTATEIPGLFAAGEVAGGLHGANRLGGNSLSDLLVFGRRAGLHAAEYAKNFKGTLSISSDQLDSLAAESLKPFENSGSENPYTIHQELQETMQSWVGIIRIESELKIALEKISQLKARAKKVHVEGHRQYNPGWHSALDLSSLLLISEAVTKSALERKESRGGHARDDYPKMDPNFAKVNVAIRKRENELVTTLEPIAPIPEELKKIFTE